ncbi:DUF4054 domain-containing protein [Leptospira bandrabouensis]|uniref:DUF4054 domain-containing protein n=1 Tax=Leptospira bandrabouensis TaxID=2484903 RepID=UPI00223C9CDA|nr:DUF4054 domain-containing protein [Leptospira bandrabouensis]MCW7459550.1 DUF4054 domain-containing protein [Leptospira bandrabouensis]MCW7478432.1 DUF4054 domain-containing protein [Leptospira bandrabouensis]MCW7486284.1 DUF4054 domain-containing protein [Leptospira bandrabouensis]
MGLSTVQQLRSFLLDRVQSVGDDILLIYLDDAKGTVSSAGVSDSHERFAELQRYFTAHLLETMGIIPKTVASESADGISRSFDTAFIPGSKETYLDLYKRKLHEVNGFKGRIF